jgi:hypothetical protein
MLSDHSSVLSQPMSSGHFSMVSKDASMVSAALSEAKRYAKIKPRFAEFVCEYHEVCHSFHILSNVTTAPGRYTDM